MEQKKLRGAVIGAGGWGYQHARAFSGRSDTELVAIAGRTQERTAKRAAEKRKKHEKRAGRSGLRVFHADIQGKHSAPTAFAGGGAA